MRKIFTWFLSIAIHIVILLYGFTETKNLSQEKTTRQQIATYECSFIQKEPFVQLPFTKKAEVYQESSLVVEKAFESDERAQEKQQKETEPDFAHPIIDKTDISLKKYTLADRFTSQRLIEKKNRNLSSVYSEDSDYQTNHLAVSSPQIKSSQEIPVKEEKDIIIPPQLVQKWEIPYPKIAKRMNLSGRILLHVQVLTTGKVGKIKILKSSGYEILDSQAAKNVQMWLFAPALKNERKVISWIKVPILFQLPK